MSASCPDHHTLAAYSLQSLPADKHGEIEMHALLCPRCQLWLAACEADAQAGPDIPVAELVEESPTRRAARRKPSASHLSLLRRLRS